MAFVLDSIKNEDVKKYDMLADYRLSRPYQFSGVWANLIISNSERQWVVDRVEDVYLRFGGWGDCMGGKINHTYFLFYYKGVRCYMDLEIVHQTGSRTLSVKSCDVMTKSKVHLLLLGDVEDLFKVALKQYLCGIGWYWYSRVFGVLDVVFMPDCMRGVRSDLRVY